MTRPTYHKIVQHYERCLLEHGDTSKGVDWPNEQDARTRYRVMLDVIRDNGEHSLSLLDFGCGASHLYAFLSESGRPHVVYTGLDISERFCQLSKAKYPTNEYQCFDVLEEPSRLKTFDYVVMNGVFTEKRELTFDEMFDYFKKLIRLAFEKTEIGLAFNVMSSLVDWERDDLFHLPLELLMPFLHSDLSRNIVIRGDYGLYEYTVYVYKEAVNG